MLLNAMNSLKVMHILAKCTKRVRLRAKMCCHCFHYVNSWPTPTQYSRQWNSEICLAPIRLNTILQIRSLHVCRFDYAGHNKWSKVRHIKGPKDKERADLISKFVKQIRIAIRDGGTNPDVNTALMQAIKLAKDKGVPKATIENALTNTVKSKSNRYILEAKGPIGSLFVIDMSAEQLSKSKSELSKILNKHGGSMLDSGSALQIFLRKGILRVPTQLLSEEDAMDVAIEVGSENIEIIRDDKISVMFYCDPKDMREVGNNLISLKYPPESTTIDYIAESPLIVDDNNFKKISRLIEALEDHESVLKVYHNVTTKETDNKI